MSQYLKQDDDLGLPLLTREAGDDPSQLAEPPSYGRMARVVAAVWTACAVVGIATMAFTGTWTDLVENSKDIFDDIRSNMGTERPNFPNEGDPVPDYALLNYHMLTYFDEHGNYHMLTYDDHGNILPARASPSHEEYGGEEEEEYERPVQEDGDLEDLTDDDERPLVRVDGDLADLPTSSYSMSNKVAIADRADDDGEEWEEHERQDDLDHDQSNFPDVEDESGMVHVIDLTVSNFDDFLESKPLAFVDFFAPWCEWCQRLAPTWEIFAQQVERAGLPVAVGKVDCMAHTDLCGAEDIMAYPTLRFYQDSVTTRPDYMMDRTVAALMGFVVRKVEESYPEFPVDRVEVNQVLKYGDIEGLPTPRNSVSMEDDDEEEGEESEGFVKLDTDDIIEDAESDPDMIYAIEVTESNWGDFLESKPLAFVDFFAPWCVWCQRLTPIWESVAQQVEQRRFPVAVGKVDCMAHADLCRAEEVMAYPTLRLYQDGAATRTDYKMDRNVETLMGTLMGYLSHKVEWLDFPLVSEDGHLEDLPIPSYSVSNEDDDEEEGEEPKQPENEGQEEESERPAELDNEENNFRDSDMVHAIDLVPFLRASLSNVDDDAERPDPEGQEEESERLVKLDNEENYFRDVENDLGMVHAIDVTESNWGDFLESKPLAFVDFFMPWCEWSQRLAPTWELFAEQVEQAGLPVAVGKVNCMAHTELCRAEDIIAYPTLRFYRDSSVATRSDYAKNRTVEDFMEYVMQKMEYYLTV